MSPTKFQQFIRLKEVLSEKDGELVKAHVEIKVLKAKVERLELEKGDVCPVCLAISKELDRWSDAEDETDSVKLAETIINILNDGKPPAPRSPILASVDKQNTNETRVSISRAGEGPAVAGNAGNGKVGWQKCTKRPVTIEFREAVPGETITTIEGVRIRMTADHLVLRGTRGELYPITKSIFREAYTRGEKKDWWDSELILCSTCGHPGSLHFHEGSSCGHFATDGKNTVCSCTAFTQGIVKPDPTRT